MELDGQRYDNSYAIELLIHMEIPNTQATLRDNQWAIAMGVLALARTTNDLTLSDDAKMCLREMKKWGKLDCDRQFTPVAESLPDEDGDYLVITENDRGIRRRQVSSFVKYDDIGYSWGIETSPIYTVKAWCELPPMLED